MESAFDPLQWPLQTVSAAEPCGPDLDLDGDAAYLNFVAMIEGRLPTRYFEFDRGKADLAGQLPTLQALKARTQDLRLFVIEAKIHLLEGDLQGFSDAVCTMAALVSQRWDTVHPRPFEGDFGLRLASFHALEDPAPVLLPLQHVPLFAHRQIGSLIWRYVQLARSEVRPRDKETAPDEGTLERVLAEVEMAPLVEARDRLHRIVLSLKAIESITEDRIGYAEALHFDKLMPIVRAMLSYLDGYVARRDPSLAVEAAAAAPSAGGEATEARVFVTAQAIDGVGRARAALTAAAHYFMLREPSSPALLLITQAQRMIGLPFAEIVEMLFPSYSDDARVQFGQGQMFRLALQRVVSQASSVALPPAPDAGGEEAVEPYPVPDTRGAALATINDVANWFRSAQPSSPIPLILDRARLMSEKDFLSLARDLLPPDALGIQP